MEFWIDDDAHCETRQGSYATYEDAHAELERLALVPWGEEPNIPPRSTGLECKREWLIYEVVGGNSVRRGPSLVIDAQGSRWTR